MKSSIYLGDDLLLPKAPDEGPAVLTSSDGDVKWKTGGEGQTFTMISSFDLDTLLTLVPNYGDVAFVVDLGRAEGGPGFPWFGTVANVTNNREIAAYGALVLSGTALVIDERPKVETLLKEMSSNKVIPFGGIITSEDSYPSWYSVINYPSIILDKNIVDDDIPVDVARKAAAADEYKIFGTTSTGGVATMLALNLYANEDGDIVNQQIEVGDPYVPILLQHGPFIEKRLGKSSNTYWRNIPVRINHEEERLAYISDLENIRNELQGTLQGILASFAAFDVRYVAEDGSTRHAYGRDASDYTRLCTKSQEITLYASLADSEEVTIPKVDIMSLKTYAKYGVTISEIQQYFMTDCSNVEEIDLSGLNSDKGPHSVMFNDNSFMYCNDLKYIKFPSGFGFSGEYLMFCSTMDGSANSYLNGIAIDSDDQDVVGYILAIFTTEDGQEGYYRKLYRYTDSPVDTVVEQK